MSESLPDLIATAMSRFGVQSVRALYRRLPDGADRMTYETFRKLSNGEQRGVRDPRVVRDLQIILEEPEPRIRAALNMGPTYGPWELPPRAQGLNPQERRVVVEVIDTILLAKRGGETDANPAEARKKIPTVAEARRARQARQDADALPEDRAASHQDDGLSDPE